LVGLVGLYARQSQAAGALGLVGFLVAFAGTVLVAGFVWASIFIAPAVATEAPEFLDAGPPPGLFLALITCALGWLLFGIAALRARVYPRRATILLIVGAVIFVLPLPLTAIVLSVAVAWLGFHLFTGSEGAAEAQPSPRVS
jgi:Na+-driven multidrug efflux pump